MRSSTLVPVDQEEPVLSSAPKGLERLSVPFIPDLLDLCGGISGKKGIVGLRMDLGVGLAGAANDWTRVSPRSCHAKLPCSLTARLFPFPDFKTSMPPGPILLLRDFLQPALPAAVLATSTVMFSLSIFLRTGE